MKHAAFGCRRARAGGTFHRGQLRALGSAAVHTDQDAGRAPLGVVAGVLPIAWRLHVRGKATLFTRFRRGRGKHDDLRHQGQNLAKGAQPSANTKARGS